jgi:NAD(P)H-dependent flavin oxidoreductase YrpB (nitropropane dioxygenase family)
MSFLDQLGLEHPIVQAGMGGGIATGALAGEVSAAGGLGTVGMLPPGQLQQELGKARERAGRAPVAANLLVPFVTREHVEACRSGGARLVVLHGGFERSLVEELRAGSATVLPTVGTAEETRRVLAEGADGVVLQGIEAGGHLVGVELALQALPAVLDAAAGAPVLLAGGIADHADARRALDEGAVAAVAGTRFLLTHESAAHPQYKRRVLAAQRTIETQLFGLGWPMRHRVVPNAATDRW